MLHAINDVNTKPLAMSAKILGYVGRSGMVRRDAV